MSEVAKEKVNDTENMHDITFSVHKQEESEIVAKKALPTLN
jgi:hypothetical protein